MMVPRAKSLISPVVIGLAMLCWEGAATAQQGAAQGPGRGQGWWMEDGTMMGPGMMGRGDWGRSCGPAAMGLGQWRIDRLEREIKLTDAQRARLDDLKAASTKAAEQLSSVCADGAPNTMPGRLEAMETRLGAMLQGIKTVRPAVDAFYDSLTDEQKAQIDNSQGRGRFWRWMHKW